MSPIRRSGGIPKHRLGPSLFSGLSILFLVLAPVASRGAAAQVTATAPADRSLPFMIAASISFSPVSEKTDPFPALNNGESSMTITDAVTASRAVPPASRMAEPLSSASCNLSR